MVSTLEPLDLFYNRSSLHKKVLTVVKLLDMTWDKFEDAFSSLWILHMMTSFNPCAHCDPLVEACNFLRIQA